MPNKKQRLAFVFEAANPLSALLLKRLVANRQDLVGNQNIGIHLANIRERTDPKERHLTAGFRIPPDLRRQPKQNGIERLYNVPGVADVHVYGRSERGKAATENQLHAP